MNFSQIARLARSQTDERNTRAVAGPPAWASPDRFARPGKRVHTAVPDSAIRRAGTPWVRQRAGRALIEIGLRLAGPAGR